jgi:hypothetical protein
VEFETLRLAQPTDAARCDLKLERASLRAEELATPRTPIFSLKHRDAPEQRFLTATRGVDGYALALAGVGLFLVAPGLLRYALEEGSSRLSLEQALVDQILPRALHLMGKPCLHASAAWVDGLGAIAFTGDSGAGKSTLCGALATRGRIVSDDSLSLEVTEAGLLALPGYPSLRLWHDAATALAPEAAALARATPRSPKLRMPAPLVTEPVPLRAIVVLERHDDPESVLDVLHGQAAFLALQQQVHRLAHDDPGALAAEFHLLTQIIYRARVFRLRYRPDLGALDALLDLVLLELRR